MTNNLFFFTLLVFILGCQQKTENTKWSLKATYYESCSCNAPCPCPFGLPMTNSFCKLNSLLEIHNGQFNNIDLKGVKVILTGSSGKWGEYYFSEATTNEQKRSIESILEIVNIAGFDTVLISKQTKINFENKDANVAFSTSNINVAMSMVKGKNNQPVIVQNLNGKPFENYIPYLSHKNVRSFSDTAHDFSFEGKAGFTSKWNLTDNDFK
jgi:Protein of unknown function (DUF1326)